MKNTSKMIRAGLVALLLSTTASIFGQTTGSIPKDPLVLGPFTAAGDAGRATALGAALVPAYEAANVVLFYRPNAAGTSETGATLVASRKEDLTGVTTSRTTAEDFTHYRWSYMGQDNGAVAVDGTAFNAALDATDGALIEYVAPNDNKLPVSALTEGYHYFRVQGYIIPEGTDIDNTCAPQYSETFVVYVLPQLAVTAARADAGTGPLQYCESTAATQTDVVLQADVAYDNYLGNPALGDFDLKYTWYSIKADENGDYPIIDATKVDLTGATQQVSDDVTGTTNSFTPAISEIGEYKFFVEVEYTLKARDYDLAETAGARKRTYALYRGWVGGVDQANASRVFVTPAPGKPHITIEAILD